MEKCHREVLERSGVGTCCREVLRRVVVEKCCGGTVVKAFCGEVWWWGSVVEKCCEGVL